MFINHLKEEIIKYQFMKNKDFFLKSIPLPLSDPRHRYQTNILKARYTFQVTVYKESIL